MGTRGGETQDTERQRLTGSVSPPVLGVGRRRGLARCTPGLIRSLTEPE